MYFISGSSSMFLATPSWGKFDHYACFIFIVFLNTQRFLHNNMLEYVEGNKR
jgi:hypothetical protein